MTFDGWSVLGSALLFASAVAGPAWAQEATKVEVMAEVIHVSDQGSTVDPPQLADMKAKFDREGLKFTSFKRLSQQRVAISKKATEVALPNGKSASLTLEEIKEGTAKIRVALAPVNAVYTLGRRGDLYVQAGDYQNGKLVLALSPVSSAKPRRVRATFHRAAAPSGIVLQRERSLYLPAQ